MNPSTNKGSNYIDELRYLFLASQIDLLDTPKNLGTFQYQSETLGVAVAKMDPDPILQKLTDQRIYSLCIPWFIFSHFTNSPLAFYKENIPQNHRTSTAGTHLNPCLSEILILQFCLHSLA